MRRLLPLLLGLVACGDAGPTSAPGTMTVTVDSPQGAEGAAVVDLVGPGLGGASALDGRVFSEPRGDTLRVVVVAEPAGTLRFGVEVPDTTRPPVATLHEVAGPDDRLRVPFGGYRVEVRP